MMFGEREENPLKKLYRAGKRISEHWRLYEWRESGPGETVGEAGLC
jgi:hypothetical protein